MTTKPIFYKIPEVADMLKVSSRTVRRWIESGGLPVHHLGGSVRVSEADLEAFLALRRDG